MQPCVLLIPHGFQQHYDLGFANAVARKGFRVDLVCSNNMSRESVDKRITCNYLGQNKNETLSFAKRAELFLRYHTKLIILALHRRHTIMHITGGLRFEWLTGVLEALIFRFLGRGYVLTVHNIVPHDRNTRLYRLKYRLVYGIPHFLIVHTEKMKRELTEHFGICARRIVVMQHGINDIVPDHGRPKRECREAIGAPLNKLLLLFFGNLLPYKGLGRLLEAMKVLDERFALVVAGKPKQKTYEALITEIIDNHSARQRIVFRPGWVADEDVATYFRAADAVVMPYQHIDQSGVLFLALRFGVPIISTDVGAIRDYVGDGIGVIADGMDVEALVRAVEKFYSQRDGFVSVKITECAQRFSWDETIRPVVALYRQMWSRCEI